MAIITEYDEDQIDPPGSPSKSKPKLKPKPKPKSKPEREPEKPNSQPPRKPRTQNSNPFIFWFYFTVTVSLITFIFVSLSSLSPQDPKTWFLGLPTSLRAHFSSGRPIKVQISPNEPPIEVFTYSQGSPTKTSETVLIIHGLGCSSFTFRSVINNLASKGVFGVAIDLPGSGFSDKTVVKEREFSGGLFGRVLDVYDEIKEKGIFWGLDNLVEHGYVPYDEVGKNRVRVREVVEPLEMGPHEMGRVLGQVVESLGLAPFHLVLHDSALVLGANWVVENSGSLRSLTILDALSNGGMALPLLALEVPVVREVVLGVDFVFRRVIDSCCSKVGKGEFSVGEHRVLLKGRDGRAAVVATGKRLNQSFDLGEWASVDVVKGIPKQVVWSSGWSNEWSEEGKRVAGVVAHGKLVTHSGGRWPQDSTSGEIAEYIYSFVSSLPKTDRQVDEEPLPEHIQKMFEEAKHGDHHHHHGHGNHHDGHGHGHSHGHGAHAGYMDAYGLGQGHGWGM